MSSTSNVQNLLVNVVRPTYKWEAGTGFVPSVTLSNVTELIAGKVKTSALVVSDSNVNTFIGSNAGCNATTSSNNVGIGYSAMGGVVNADSNVAVGALALDGFSNGSNNTVIGAGADINAEGDSNIILGTNTTITNGSNSIIIGNGITWGNGNYINIGGAIYSTNGYVGIRTAACSTPFHVAGLSYFEDKVGIQVLNPTYSLDVLGTAYATTRFLTGAGSTPAIPAYSFSNVPTTGVYQASDASYGTGALGVSISGAARVVVASNKTYIYGDLDVCGAFSSASGGGGGGGGSGTVASNGTAAAPSFTFSNDLSTGLHLGGTSYLAFDTSGVQRMCISGAFVGIGTPTPRVTLDVSGDISANVYNGPGGTQSAPHYTFSDDRTTGVFFPGANIVGFTAGGTERMRISNGNVGIGTTSPTNALDVAGTIRVIGGAGDITLTNGAIAIGGSTVVSSAGVLSNSAGTSNSIGGVVLETSNVRASAFESSPSTSNSIGGVTLSNSNAIVGGFLRNALTPTTYDISAGNISNSGVHTTAGLVGTYLRNALTPTTYDISAGNISNSGTTRSSNFISTVNTASNQLGGITLSNGILRYTLPTDGFVVATGEGTNTLAYSSDGITWTGNGKTIFSGGSRGVAWSGTRWVAVGTGTNSIAYSSDGITWTGIGTSIFTTGGNGVAWNGSLFVAVGDGTNAIATSPDGITWTGRVASSSSYGTGVAWNGSLWVVTGVGGSVAGVTTSPDGITWTSRTTSGSTVAWSVAWNGSKWVVGAQGTTNIYTSDDGITWTGQSDAIGNPVLGVAWTGTLWVAAGSPGGGNSIQTSSDGTSWTGRGGGSLFTTTGWGVASERYVLPVIADTVTDISSGTIGLSGKITTLNAAATHTIATTTFTNRFVGILTTSPAYALDICGTVRALEGLKQGTNTWGSYSDRRVKHDIHTADTSLCYSIIKRLPLKRFTWDISLLPTIKDKTSVGWIAQDVEQVFPRAVAKTTELGMDDLRVLDVDQIYKTMYGALEKVIADKEALEAKFTKALARIAVLETALDISYTETAVDVSSTVLDVSGASLQSSESTQPTLPTPPPPEEPPVSEPAPQPQPSSEYAPAPAETEA